MRLTIMPSNNIVIIDNEFMSDLDLTGIDPNIHAVQFYNGQGFIEYKNRPPEAISSIKPFQPYIEQFYEKQRIHERRKTDPYYGMDEAEKFACMKQDKLMEAQNHLMKMITIIIDDQEYEVSDATIFALYLKQKQASTRSELETNRDTKLSTHNLKYEVVELYTKSQNFIDSYDLLAAMQQKLILHKNQVYAFIHQINQATTSQELEALHFDTIKVPKDPLLEP